MQMIGQLSRTPLLPMSICAPLRAPARPRARARFREISRESVGWAQLPPHRPPAGTCLPLRGAMAASPERQLSRRLSSSLLFPPFPGDFKTAQKTGADGCAHRGAFGPAQARS